MSRIEDYYINSHRNIYTNEERSIPIKIAVPNDGIDKDTIMLVITYGYGATYTSNIFMKLMDALPDKYNMVVVSGEYFGSCFMKPGKVEIDLSDGMLEHTQNGCYETIFAEECEHEFNDMGPQQALDIVSITLEACRIIKKDSYELKHLILFGSSHGGYISHLANLMCPNLYSYILDISSYIFPYFLGRLRKLKFSSDYVNLFIGWRYFINDHQEYQVDPNLLDLKYLYSHYKNRCRIISFHGTQDWMVDYKEKQELIDIIGDEAEYILFTPKEVDGEFIKDANHSLGMNFEMLFEMIIPLIMQTNVNRECIDRKRHILGEGEMILDYSTGLPNVEYVKINNQFE